MNHSWTDPGEAANAAGAVHMGSGSSSPWPVPPSISVAQSRTPFSACENLCLSPSIGFCNVYIGVEALSLGPQRPRAQQRSKPSSSCHIALRIPVVLGGLPVGVRLARVSLGLVEPAGRRQPQASSSPRVARRSFAQFVAWLSDLGIPLGLCMPSQHQQGLSPLL